MPKTSREIPPPLELLCLRTLWVLEEANVSDVRRVIADARPLAYTTVMTVLDRLLRKGMIVRRKVGRAFMYAPAASRDTMRRVAVRELVDGFFDGSEEKLLEYLQGRGGEARAQAPAPDGEARIDTVLL